MKTTVQVAILGQTYTLRSESSAEEMQRVVGFVNAALAEVAAVGKTVDSHNVAVLALLNVAQSFLQMEQQLAERQNLEQRLAVLLNKIENFPR